jgi:hypothetical protein
VSALDRRTLVFLDLTVAVWVLVWLVIGYVVHQQVLELRKLSATMVVAGQALDTSAAELRSLSGVPFVGRRVERTAAQAHRAAVSARFSGRESRKSVAGVANWLWFSVSAIAIFPVLLVYGLVRFGRRSA